MSASRRTTLMPTKERPPGLWYDPRSKGQKFYTNPANSCTKPSPRSAVSRAKCPTSADAWTARVVTLTASMTRMKTRKLTEDWALERPCSSAKSCTVQLAPSFKLTETAGDHRNLIQTKPKVLLKQRCSQQSLEHT
uniref:(northern house mosquito) hypothetical protein n=1 Tax=Culex pipiens TaxID=7175 RepID=A0A8D8GL68_CULPI